MGRLLGSPSINYNSTGRCLTGREGREKREGEIRRRRPSKAQSKYDAIISLYGYALQFEGRNELTAQRSFVAVRILFERNISG